jgi:hypothetical protein
MKTLAQLLTLSAVLFTAVSCATLDQKTSLAPIAADFPVSASKALYIDGKTVTEAQFSSTKPFEAKKVVKLPVLQKTAAIDLAPDLKAQLSGTDYNGIVQLKVSVKDIDSSAIEWIALERNLGFTTLFGGAALIGVSLSPESKGGLSLVPGAVLMGMGAAFLGGSAWHEKAGTIDYTYSLSGVSVKY